MADLDGRIGAVAALSDRAIARAPSRWFGADPLSLLPF
jgi:hypothetical protein